MGGASLETFSGGGQLKKTPCIKEETHHDRNIRSILNWLHAERVLGTQLVVVVEAAEKGGFRSIVKDETK